VYSTSGVLTFRLGAVSDPDDQLIEVGVMRSSSTNRINGAAIRIAELSVPFDSLPRKITRNIGDLYIILTWHLY
jgi:hypothetical protein